MNDAYQWWLFALIAAGVAAALWFMRGTVRRREVDVAEDELPAEARWVAEQLLVGGRQVDVEDVQRVLELHRSYLDEPPPGAPGSPLVPAAANATAYVPDPASEDDPAEAITDDEMAASTRARRRSSRELRRARYETTGSEGSASS